MMLALHLSVVQATTWVLVPNDTLTGPLWVGATKATLFRGLLHINAARELVAKYSMRWWQFFLRYFSALILSCTFIVHILINRTSWNVTLDNRTHLLTPFLFSWVDIPPLDIPPRPTSPSLYSHNLLVKFNVLLLPYCWSILGSLCLLEQGPWPNIYLGLRPHN